ncbi:MAG: Rrf2 family transcriptional regulator [Candidatus Kerfeldbacteria bacterium]|nr:Rrf2 family transcriptional regulator [Candidatus Kerfeldbacteria bacterium]
MFKISRKTDYAVVFLTLLAQNRGQGFVSLTELSNQFNIPYRFLSKIATNLHHLGIVRAKEGVDGGYELACDPREVTFADILRATEGDLEMMRCLSKHESCSIRTICPSRVVWVEIQMKVNEIIDGYTLQDILDQRLHSGKRFTLQQEPRDAHNLQPSR